MGAHRATWLAAETDTSNRLASRSSYDGLTVETPAPAILPAAPSSGLGAVHGVMIAVTAGALLWGGLFALVRWLIF